MKQKIYDLVEAFIDQISAQSKELGLFFDPDEDIERQLYCVDNVCRLTITLDDASDFLTVFRFVCKYAYDNNSCIIDNLNYHDHVIIVDIMTDDARICIFYK